MWRPTGREELSAKLKAARQKKGITYAELAKRLGVNKTWLACAIDGQHGVLASEFATRGIREPGKRE